MRTRITCLEGTDFPRWPEKSHYTLDLYFNVDPSVKAFHRIGRSFVSDDGRFMIDYRNPEREPTGKAGDWQWSELLRRYLSLFTPACLSACLPPKRVCSATCVPFLRCLWPAKKGLRCASCVCVFYVLRVRKGYARIVSRPLNAYMKLTSSLLFSKRYTKEDLRGSEGTIQHAFNANNTVLHAVNWGTAVRRANDVTQNIAFYLNPASSKRRTDICPDQVLLFLFDLESARQ